MHYSIGSPYCNCLIRVLIGILLLATPNIFSADLKMATQTWDAELKKYVKNGRVDYTSWGSAREPLKKYLNTLSSLPKTELKSLSREAQMAHYINAYNAFTIEIILNNPQIKSIRDIKPNAWKQEFVSIAGKTMSLDYLENDILRPKYRDPRIHFSIVCASLSCPPLVPTAFTENNLESLLETNTINFLKNNEQNYFAGNTTKVSKIFEWFKMDFEKFEGGLTGFFKKYAPNSYDPKKKITYFKYDWGLNKK